MRLSGRWAMRAACVVLAGSGLAAARAQTSDCAVASDQALAADLEAATTPHMAGQTAEAVKRWDQAVAWWEQAAQVCQGAFKQRAERNLADSQQARARLLTGSSGGQVCSSSHKDAAGLDLLAEVAAVERREADAALLFRKAAVAWELAAERCQIGRAHV